MTYAQKTCTEFTDLTFSKEAVPGGGGVSALVGALGVALGGMVCNLTAGKKKYAEYEEDIQRIMKQAEGLKESLLSMIDEDAENFLPLSKAYGLPKETPEEKANKEKVLEECLKVAVGVPVKIVKTAYEAISLFDELTKKGSKLAMSDVGCGVALLRSAITGGWLNVVININMIKDEKFTSDIRSQLEPMLKEGMARCDEIYNTVLNSL